MEGGVNVDKLNIKYEFSTSAISDIHDINSSFAKGRLKVMYLGSNRNKTFFSRDAVQKALPSLRNVPIVCNWNYEEGTIGGHDMNLITDYKGDTRLINFTEPCGVVPECAKFSFVTEFDDNGVNHDYLVIDDVILWKRQDVFNHIKDDLDGKVDHSMEITIFDKSTNSDGQIDITDFEFTALCLLERDKPCFSGSELELYSVNDSTEKFRAKFEEMLNELKEISPVKTSDEVEDKFSVKGGDEILEEKNQLIAKYGLNAEDLNIDIENISMEDLEAKLKEYSSNDGGSEPSPEPEPVPDNTPSNNPENTYALEQEFKSELCRVLETEKVVYEWGSVPRYSFVDYDKESGEVYAWDESDWLLYGFTYTVDGDTPKIDFACKKRKKFAIVDFEGEEQSSPFAQVYSQMNEKIKSDADDKSKFTAMESEITELRKFKSDVELANANEAKQNVIAQFSDLQGNEAFESLVSDISKYDIESLEEKCYAIRGRMSTMKFSAEPKMPKQIVPKPEDNHFDSDPYGGIVDKYK